MALRSGHGSGSGVPRIEVLPADELPAGIPASARESEPADRVERGLFARGNGLAAEGGRAKAGQTRLARRLSLLGLPEGAPFAPYRRAASAFRRFQVSRLASTVGAGECGPAPASIVATAALQLASSRYLFDRAAVGDCDPKALELASRLANDSRQNLLAAHELCAREAKARPRQSKPVWQQIVESAEPETNVPARPSESARFAVKNSLADSTERAKTPDSTSRDRDQ